MRVTDLERGKASLNMNRLVSPCGLLACLLLGGAALSGGCSGSEAPPVISDPGGLDGGVGGRPVAPGRDGAADGATSADGMTGDAPVAGMSGDPSIVIRVAHPAEEPMPRSVVSARVKFEPSVEISVAGSGGTFDDVRTVRAAVGDGMMVYGATTELNATRPPEVAAGGQVKTFFFGATPVPLAGLVSGATTLRIEVQTIGGRTATKVVPFTVDAGPRIVFVTPASGAPFKGQVVVEFRVEDAFPVGTVELYIGDRMLPVQMGMGGSYTATVVFDDPMFRPPLDGEQLLTVRATNRNGTATVAAREFVVDTRGPVITETKPAVGELMGSVVRLSANVTDPAGVVPESVVAVIAHGGMNFEVRLNPPPPGSNTYSGVFDGNRLPQNALFPSVSFRASDTLGNESAVGYQAAFDNMPPQLDLDPPLMRRAKVVSGVAACSWEFDPVGPDAADDGQLVYSLFNVRARVEDRGNDVAFGGANLVPIAGTKRVDLLVLDDTSRALIVDTDNDGVCDAINPTLRPSSTPMPGRDLLLLSLIPIPPRGGADFTGAFQAGQPACLIGVETTIPDPMCPTVVNGFKTIWDFAPNSTPIAHGHRMSTAIGYNVANEPAIWTIAPITDRLECAGRQFDVVGSQLRDGWACLAVAAWDKLDKGQVSRPLRVCIDHDGDGAECPHRSIATVSAGTPMLVTTVQPHGLTTGAEVFIQDVFPQTGANGKHRITVTGPSSFTLNGSAGVSQLGAATGGLFVPTAALPPCVGVQTRGGDNPQVDDSASCSPWRPFEAGEIKSEL